MSTETSLPLWTLVQTANLAAARFRSVFAEASLSPAQYGVLASLADGDDLTQAELARAVLTTPQSINRLVSDMIEVGLVRRSGPSGRGRRSSIELTDRGRAAVALARPAAYAANRHDQIGLSEREARQLDDLLRKVRSHLQAG